MRFQNVLTKSGIAAGLNGIIGKKFLGVGAAIASDDLGGYVNTRKIGDYMHNPDDGRWYKTPPAPALGQFAWESPVPENLQGEISRLKNVNDIANEVQKRKPDNDIII